jgi:hypothetical protein
VQSKLNDLVHDLNLSEHQTELWDQGLLAEGTKISVMGGFVVSSIAQVIRECKHIKQREQRLQPTKIN